MKKTFGAKIGFVPYATVIIGTYDENGIPDAMNVGWGMQVGSKQVAINILQHKTLDNLRFSKAFTMSFATRDTAVASDYVGLVSGAKEPEKIKKSGLTEEHSPYVDAPAFAEYPMTFHCKLVSITEEFGAYRVVGEIVETTIDEEVLDEKGLPDFLKMQPIVFEDTHKYYHVLGERVGKAFSIGRELMKNKS